MTPDEYWYGNPQLFYNYKKAYEIKQKKLEQHIWLASRYNQSAFSSSVLNVIGITDYKKYKIPEMVDCPHTQEVRQLTQKEVENERLRAYAFFKNLKIKE